MSSVNDVLHKLDELHSYGFPDVHIRSAGMYGVDIATRPGNEDVGVIRTPDIDTAIETLQNFQDQCYGPPTPTK